MQRLQLLLEELRHGTHTVCSHCSWNPRAAGRMAFGSSCSEHGHSGEDAALVLSLAQDPGGTTPEVTSRLCPVHNSENSSDKSAAHGFDLWRAAVSLRPYSPDYRDPFMKRTYYSNALLHGIPTRDARTAEERSRLGRSRRQALGCCVGALRLQFEVLQPRVVLAHGEVAATALALVAPGEWSQSTRFGVPKRPLRVPGVPHQILGLRFIHASARGTNLVAAPLARRLFSSTESQESAVRSQIELLPEPSEAQRLLFAYQPSAGMTDTTYRGMMLHLSWWIDAGEAIRGLS
jgi:hypothetical protein